MNKEKYKRQYEYYSKHKKEIYEKHKLLIPENYKYEPINLDDKINAYIEENIKEELERKK